MKKYAQMVFIAAAVMIPSCEAPLKVTADYDKGTDFMQYRTFAMVSLSAKDQSLSQLNANRIIGAIKNEMAKKGFIENVTDPDLKVNAVTIMINKSELSSSSNYYGYGGVYRPYGWGMSSGHTTYNVRDFIDGSLIVEVIDARENRLLWEGGGNKEIDSPSKDPDKTIPQAVADIMKSFPPGATNSKK